jgi:polar amino acid transport system substrate-binding protein
MNVTATILPKMQKSKWFLLLLSLNFSGFAIAQTKTLVVGMELSYPPFEMTDTQGKPTGVSVEIAEALAKYLGAQLKIENISYDGLIPSLKTSKVDCIISSMTATAERAKSVDFSDPYLMTGLSLLVSAKSTVTSVDDLNQKDRVVAVKKGTTGHQYAVKNLGNARVLVLDKESAAVLEVSQGKADAFIYDKMSVFRHHRRNISSTRAILLPFKQESWAIAVRQGNKKLLAKINAFLSDFKKNGGFEKLGDKYLGEEKRIFKEMGVPFLF